MNYRVNDLCKFNQEDINTNNTFETIEEYKEILECLKFLFLHMSLDITIHGARTYTFGVNNYRIMAAFLMNAVPDDSIKLVSKYQMDDMLNFYSVLPDIIKNNAAVSSLITRWKQEFYKDPDLIHSDPLLTGV